MSYTAPIAPGKEKPMSDLAYLSATEALSRFQSKELSPVELLEAVFDRIDEVNPHINAFTAQSREEAVLSARLSERRWASGEPIGPLDGVPFAFKEEHSIAGLPEQGGSLLQKGNIADHSHPIVERVLSAGAVMHGRTTTPEFSAVPWTNTKLWGITRNPWNPLYSPGGSSGGSAAALAAGMTTLASGSDIGGSIRLPASFCGLIGYKPPFGRVPATSPYNQDVYCADGPLGRTVADVALLQNVLTGPHPADQVSLRPKYVLPKRFEGLAGMRIALSIDLGAYQIDAEVRRNTLSLADALRTLGATVDEVDLPWNLDTIQWAGWTHFRGMAEAIGEVPRLARHLLMPATRHFARSARSMAKGHSITDGLDAETELYAPLGAIFEDYEALICPTFPGTAFLAGVDHTRTPVQVDDTLVEWSKTLMTVPFNMIGRVPVLNVPSGLSANGVPTGVQIVGRTYDDITPFRIGSALEHDGGVWTDDAWRPADQMHSAR